MNRRGQDRRAYICTMLRQDNRVWALYYIREPADVKPISCTTPHRENISTSRARLAHAHAAEEQTVDFFHSAPFRSKMGPPAPLRRHLPLFPAVPLPVVMDSVTTLCTGHGR